MNVFGGAAGFLSGLDNVLLLLKLGVALLALLATAYVLRSLAGTLGPLARALQWLFALPEDVAAGLAHGVRLLIWAAVVAAGLWIWLG
jgi:hypothetical protein